MSHTWIKTNIILNFTWLIKCLISHVKPMPRLLQVPCTRLSPWLCSSFTMFAVRGGAPEIAADTVGLHTLGVLDHTQCAQV